MHIKLTCFVNSLLILLFAFIYVCIKNFFYDESTIFFLYSLIGCLENVLFLFAYRSITGYFLSFSVVFIECLFIFHFGQILLLGFFYSYLDNIKIVINLLGADVLIDTYSIINTVFVSIIFGVLSSEMNIVQQWISSNIHGGEQYRIDKCCFNYQLLKRRAIQIIMITFPVKFFIDMYRVYLGIVEGLDASFALKKICPDIFVSWGRLSMVGALLLLIAYREKTKKQTALLILIICYTLLTMAGGNRGEGVAFICVATLLYLNDKKIKKIYQLLMCVLGYLLCTFLSGVVYVRGHGGNLISAFGAVISEQSVILNALREYGQTGYTAVCVAYANMNGHIPSMGESYYYGMASVFPNIDASIGKYSHLSNFGFMLQESNYLSGEYFNIGGSIIGELLFNFGNYYSVIPAFILGYFIGYISRELHRRLRHDISYRITYYLVPLVGIIYWIRSYFEEIVRWVVWGLIFCFMIHFFGSMLKKIRIKW